MTNHYKKITLLFIMIAVSVFVTAIPACAQDHIEKSKIDVEFNHHEFRLGAAWRPFLADLTLGTNMDIMDEQKGWKFGTIYTMPLLSFSYEYYFKKWFSLSCNTSVGVLFRAAYQEGSGNDPIIENGVATSLTVNARFTYLNSKWVRLYSSLGIGAAYVGGFAPTFEVVPFGLTVGRKFFFFAEGGIGMEYWGANAGIGYRF